MIFDHIFLTAWYSLKNEIVTEIFQKKKPNEFKFTTIIPQIDLFAFVLWKKLKTPKIYF